MARGADPMSYTGAIAYVYFPEILIGMLRPTDSAMSEIEEAVRIAERSGDDMALAFASLTLGVALVPRRTAPEHDRAQDLLIKIGTCTEAGDKTSACYRSSACASRWRSTGAVERDEAIVLMRAAADDLFRYERLPPYGAVANRLLMETLLERGADGDVAEAEAAFERLIAAPAEDELVTREIWLPRLRAGLQRARGDEAGYREYRSRYRDLAETLASRAISTGPRRWRDGDGRVPDLWHRAAGDARFCQGCRTPVHDGDARAEYKQVTVCSPMWSTRWTSLRAWDRSGYKR